MLPLPEVTVYLDLLLLFIALLPLGAVLLRLGERFLGFKASLSPPERVLLAFYASGALLFVLASLPIPFYGDPLLLTLLIGGTAAYAALCYVDNARGARVLLSFVGSIPGILLGGLLLLVLGVEVAGVASLSLTNMLDGSLHSLFVNLLVTHHTLPWTLNPYAPIGVTYPQGAPVWMSVPVLLFGWPIVSAPLDLPPLFLALSTVSAFCLGDRLSRGLPQTSHSWPGLLFAAVFGLTFTWPRLFVGGSFDFAFGLPLFLPLVGWLVSVVQGPRRGWGEIVALGIVTGIECSLSFMLGIGVLLLFAGYLLVFRSPTLRLHEWAVRWLAVVGISAGFLARSLAGFVTWFGYPGHVLSPIGNPPLAPPQPGQPLTYSTFTGELNPFVPLKPKVSPIPVLSVEITILILAGLILIGLLLSRPGTQLEKYLPRRLWLPILAGTLVAFAETGAILLAEAATPTSSGVGSIAYVEEASILLFVFYELIAMLPLLAAAMLVSSYVARASNPRYGKRTDTPHAAGPRISLRSHHLRVALVALVLLVPLGSGLGATAAVVPGYITDHIHDLANISAADIEALAWSGANLPSCSRVLVAPGSIGQYLPEFALVQVVFPAFPVPANLSYFLLVQDLDSGIYTNTTHSFLVQLGVTEVFVSGQNTVSFLPFQLGPLKSSPDFQVLTSMGDVTILEFLPGALGSGCSPGPVS